MIRFLGCDRFPAEDSLPGRFRAARQRRGLTQAEAAVRLGLDEGSVLDLEHGRRRESRKVRRAAQRLFEEAYRT